MGSGRWRPAAHLVRGRTAQALDHDQHQTQGLNEDAFRSNVASSLAQGRFRLVLVLDSAPPELVRSASYLQLVAEGRITLDLITMASYSVGDTELLVPQTRQSKSARVSVNCSSGREP